MNKDPKKPNTSDDDPVTAVARVTRRSFLARVGAAGAAVGAGQLPSAAFAEPDAAPASDAPAKATDGTRVHVRLNVNGRDHELNIDPRTTLLDCVRDPADRAQNGLSTAYQLDSKTDNAIHDQT